MRHGLLVILVCAAVGAALAQEGPPDGTPDIGGSWSGKAQAVELHLGGTEKNGDAESYPLTLSIVGECPAYSPLQCIACLRTRGGSSGPPACQVRCRQRFLIADVADLDGISDRIVPLSFGPVIPLIHVNAGRLPRCYRGL